MRSGRITCRYRTSTVVEATRQTHRHRQYFDASLHRATAAGRVNVNARTSTCLVPVKLLSPLSPSLPHPFSFNPHRSSAETSSTVISRMAEEITIDKAAFHDRLGSFLSAWKADKRGGDALFNGVNSIVVMVGKATEGGSYNKGTAFQVSKLGFPDKF